MNRAEFMERLRALLSDLEESEQVEALSYYEEYFDDAGAENEQELIKSLGSPEKVAKSIKEGLNDSDGKEGEFSEKGFQGYEEDGRNEVGMHQKNKQRLSDRIKGLGVGGILLFLILALFALPILAPICIGVIAMIFGIFGAAAALVCAVAIVGFALVIAGAAVFFSAFPGMLLSPAVGVLLIGLGFLLAGIGILLAILGIWIVGKLLPPIIRWIVRSIQKLFSRKEK